jgi:RHS repeat-associated protein
VEFTATTPPAASVDPRRTGISPTSATWGALGANVDLLSGNVNFNLPLLKAQARGGWGVTFSLNHDTQSWKKEGSVVWNYGRDIGYGHGWKLLAGSVTRYFSGTGVTSHIIFTDSTGTDYRLDRKVDAQGNTSATVTGYWAASSSNFYGIFHEDWNTYRMKFPDGSFWEFGSHAAGYEGDLGTAYPTLFQDSNGNRIIVRYLAGAGVAWANSSGRILQIEDVRAQFASGTWATYEFGYDYTLAVPHLTGITNRISTTEGYTFNYTTAGLVEPFTSTAWTGASSTKFLTGVTINTVGMSYAFGYYSPWTGELAKVTTPYGGYVRWNLGAWNYTGSRQLRDVWQWIHSKSGSAGDEKTYGINHEANDGSRTLHNVAQVWEPDGTVFKQWSFDAAGLTTQYDVVKWPGWDFQYRTESTWSTDANGKKYISVAVATNDPGKAFAIVKKTEQTLDVFGNMTEMKLWDWKLPANPWPAARRVYTNSYLATSPYVTAYIRNRLLVSSYTENGVLPATVLVSNAYDDYSPGCLGGAGSCAMLATSSARQKDAAYTGSLTLRGNVTSSSKFGDGSSLALPATWGWRYYDDTGNVVKTRSPQFIVGTVVEDSAKNYAVPSSMTVAGLTSTMSWNNALNLTGTTGANSETAAINFGVDARPSSKTSPTGLVTNFTYTTTTTTATTVPSGRFVKTTVDGFGRTKRVETGYGSTTVSIVDTEYQPCACTPIGKMKRVSRPYAPPAIADPPVGPDPRKWTTYNYDALGRTVGVVTPDGSSTTTYLYEGNTVKTTDAAGKWKKFTQDAVGNLTKVNEPNPALGGGADYETNYTYDKFDRLYQVSMPRPTGTQTRTFNYGSNGQLSSKIEPETGTTTMFYNSDGTVDYKLDAKGQKVQMTYDASKRVSVIKKYPDGVNEDACQRVEMFYDGTYPADGDAGVTLNANGRLSAVRYKGANCTLLNGHTYVEQYSYLNYGAMTKKRLKVIRNLSSGTASGVLESVAEYDGEGRLLATTYPVTGKRYQYGFDSRGLPSSLTNTTDSTTLVSSVVYGVAGEMTTFVHGGGTETRSYNENGQMTTLNLPGRTISYTFPSPGSNNGKVASITDSGETISYVYDSLQRLTSATGSGWSQGFAYDGFGNMNNKTATGGAPTWSASIDPATNRISTTSYDANGNQTFITTTTGIPDSFNLSYDVSNRLTLAVNAGPSIRSDYGYDAGNKRIWEKRTLSGTVNGEWFYFFGISGRRLARYNFTVVGTVLTFTQDNASVWFRGKLVQKLNTFGSSFVNEDRLGSVGKYLPYGEDRPGGTNPTGDNEKFATYTRDAANGLDYADQRWHAQGTGRFLTSDPYQASGGPTDPASWNRYGYTRSNPIGRRDRLGLADEDCEDDEDCPGNDDEDEQEQPGGAPGGPSGLMPPKRGNGPDGGPGSIFAPIANANTNSWARKLLNSKLQKLPDECLKAFQALKGFSMANVISAIYETNFYNVDLNGTLTQQDVVGNGISTTLRATLPLGWDAVTLGRDTAWHAVLFSSSVEKNLSESGQQNLLLHELMHASGWSDDEMFKAFKAFGLEKPNDGTTGEITNWLARDCKAKEK